MGSWFKRFVEAAGRSTTTHATRKRWLSSTGFSSDSSSSFSLRGNSDESPETSSDKTSKTSTGELDLSSPMDPSEQGATERDGSPAFATTPSSASPLSESYRTAKRQSASRLQQAAAGFSIDYFLSTLKSNVADGGIDSEDSSLRATPKQTSDMSRLLQDMLVRQEQMYHVHINASMNNTVLSLTDEKGNILCRSSGGTAGFKKSHRGGYEAAHQAAVALIAKAHEKGYKLQEVEVIFKGIGPGREAAYKAIAAPESKWQIRRLTDATPIPFNGCRPPKVRRL